MATIGARPGSRNDPRRKSPTSERTTASVSASTRSLLVSTVRPRRTASSRQISKCSRVCGLMPSSAATTNSSRSTPPAPASMLRTKRSCPGTSTNPRRNRPPAGADSSMWAKPRSMVMPRRFSSARRSASMPVSAFTSLVLPWSMWPAVPTMMGRSADWAEGDDTKTSLVEMKSSPRISRIYPDLKKQSQQTLP